MAFTDWTTNQVVESTALNTNFTEVIPIGGIIPWCKSFTGVSSLPASFAECDGSVISDADSPMNGETLPDLLDPQSYLRGNTTSGGTGGSDTHDHHYDITVTGTQSTISSNGPWQLSTWNHTHRLHDDSSTDSGLPKSYEVVWIMRIK